jgi:guanyl-specific ribonuclease Sa
MLLAEVAILMREIADRCPDLEGNTFALLPQKAKPAFRGYSVNIKGTFSRESIGGLRRIVEGHDLVMDIKTDYVVIYETRGFR